MGDVKTDGPARAPAQVSAKADGQDNKPGFCSLVKAWTIYYTTLTFALLAIFRWIYTLK